MPRYEIKTRSGEVRGVFEDMSPERALLAMHRAAGHGPGVVQVRGHRLIYGPFPAEGDGTGEYEKMLGAMDSFVVREIP